MRETYEESALTRAAVDAAPGLLALEFGAPWCGICAAARPALDAAFSAHSGLDRRKIWDGPGLPLGRSFGVKLWPSVVLLRAGVEVERLVRPTDAAQIEAALDRLVSGG